MSGNGTGEGGRLDATAFEALAGAAGGRERVPAFCEALQPKDEKAKQPSDSKEPKPSDNGGQGQGSGPPTSTDGGQGNQGQGGGPPTGGPRPESGRESPD